MCCDYSDTAGSLQQNIVGSYLLILLPCKSQLVYRHIFGIIWGELVYSCFDLVDLVFGLVSLLMDQLMVFFCCIGRWCALMVVRYLLV